jgi:hypothetical protein
MAGDRPAHIAQTDKSDRFHYVSIHPCMIFELIAGAKPTVNAVFVDLSE